MSEVTLTGRLICNSDAEMEMARRLMPEHIRLSRAEPGCQLFEVAEVPGTLAWQLNERFADEAAFAAHVARTNDSDWGRQSGAIKRDFVKSGG